MKRILITGARSGIGLQLAKSYLSEGYEVIACGRSLDKLNRQFFTDTKHLQLCQFDMKSRDHTLAQLSTLEPVDLAILNAGACEYTDHPKRFDSALLERVIQTNVLGTGYCLEGIIPRIKPGGQIAIVSSTVTLLPLPRAEAYGASKSALDYLARTLSIHLAPHGIDVSLIRPGFVDTPLTQKNTFSMPCIITKENACHYIMRGLRKRQQEINFPKRFFWTLKILSLLPHPIWRHLAIKMVGKQS